MSFYAYLLAKVSKFLLLSNNFHEKSLFTSLFLPVYGEMASFATVFYTLSITFGLNF